jgi:hypothetical protein
MMIQKSSLPENLSRHRSRLRRWRRNWLAARPPSDQLYARGPLMNESPIAGRVTPASIHLNETSKGALTRTRPKTAGLAAPA